MGLCVCARVRVHACVFACVSVPLRYITRVEVNPSRYTRVYYYTCVRAWVSDGSCCYKKDSGKVSSGDGDGGGGVGDGGGVGGDGGGDGVGDDDDGLTTIYRLLVVIV